MTLKNILYSLILVCIIFQAHALYAEPINTNEHFILAPQKTAASEQWLNNLNQYRKNIRQQIEVSKDNAWSIYNRCDLAWMSKNYTCRMCMMFSLDFYDPDKNEYLIESVLTDGEKEFGGYESIVLWHAYPRIGIDQRNQFDMYRDMPGGLPAIKKLVDKCHLRNVKVFINYNPWDTGTTREAKSDFEMLAEIVSTIDADGIFLDTLSAGDPNLRIVADSAKSGIAIVSEGHPIPDQLSVCSGSWGQWLEQPNEPTLLKLRWIEPRHMQYQIRRWDTCRQDEIAAAFFNASGMLIWENIFGTYNPWNSKDRLAWNRAKRVLKYFSDEFVKGAWQPYFDVHSKNVYTNRWQKDGIAVYILSSLKDQKITIKLPYEQNISFYDIWNGTEIKPHRCQDLAKINIYIDRLGCIAAIDKKHLNKDFGKFLKKMKQLASTNNTSNARNFRKQTFLSDKVKKTKLINKNNCPEGMVYIPATTFEFEIEHTLRECNCYPDTENIDTNDFGHGLKTGATYPWIIHEKIKHKKKTVKLNSFFINQTEVTNVQFLKFLNCTGYKPKHRKSFLKHWPNGKMPKELGGHPVVYVDMNDARAYAKWAGKRLPTEQEWQLAAQGTDGRKWPWGNNFDPNNCNTTGTTTLPANSLPQGKSPYACYHMSGNVWEWTESCRSDGHTRFSMIRGGSYYNAKGSIWYVKGGPQPCDHHTKFVHTWPGLDRCATIGFRCVVDASE